jgi:hypothetical protein
VTDQDRAPVDRRAMLAALLLMDELPVPQSIVFPPDGYPADLRLVFDRIADWVPWARVLGVREVYPWHSDGVLTVAQDATFAGRQVSLLAREPDPAADPPLTGMTRTRLADLAVRVA